MIIEIPKGYSFYSAFVLAKRQFDTNMRIEFVEFDFNEVNLTVQRGSVYNDIATIYDLKCQLAELRGI